MVTANLIGLGYKVIQKWECEWLQERKHYAVAGFLSENLNLGITSSKMSAAQLVKKVVTGELFGMIECDIEVPSWNKELIEHFEEFSPIC